MAIIYGRPESEREILNNFPNSVKTIEDIEMVHKKLQNQFTSEKNNFFEKLPSKIDEEENKLEKIQNDEKITIRYFDKKIKNIENKKAQGGFSTIFAPLKISFIKNFSKRREIKKIKNLEEKQQSQISEWKENPDGIFKKLQHATISEIKRVSGIKKSPMFAGASGELQVFNKLSKLSDDYHVLCGLNIGLGKYVTYNGRKNLRSAQMDFVVVSRKGVILIEVKNWSLGFLITTKKLNPYEQADRAGRVLWITLQGWWSGPRVTNVLVPIQANMPYNPNYRAVYVKNLDKINYFLENREEVLSEKGVKKIVNKLREHVTE